MKSSIESKKLTGKNVRGLDVFNPLHKFVIKGVKRPCSPTFGRKKETGRRRIAHFVSKSKCFPEEGFF